MVLVGETLMRAADPAREIRQLLDKGDRNAVSAGVVMPCGSAIGALEGVGNGAGLRA